MASHQNIYSILHPEDAMMHCTCRGAVGQWTGDRGVLGSNPAAALRFGTLAIPFISLCLCYADETLLVPSVPGEVKYLTQRVNV